MVCIHTYYYLTEQSPTLPVLQGTTPQKVFLNFLSVFGTSDLLCFADNVSADTLAWLSNNMPANQIMQTSWNSPFTAFHYMLGLLSNDNEMSNQCIVYFIDGQTIHARLSPISIREGIQLADYVTLIDSPDKYINSGQVLNQTIGGSLIWGNGEWTRLMFTAHSHWKFTYCAGLSIAATKSTLLADRDVFDSINDFDRFPMLEKLWIGLQRSNKTPRTLVSSVPGKAYMVYDAYVSPIIDWPHIL